MLTNSITPNQNKPSFGMKYNVSSKVINAGRENFIAGAGAEKVKAYDYLASNLLSAITLHNKTPLNHALYKEDAKILGLRFNNPFKFYVDIKTKRTKEPLTLSMPFEHSTTRPESIKETENNLNQLQSEIVDKTYSNLEIISNALKRQ